jgi:hypothetical protein
MAGIKDLNGQESNFYLYIGAPDQAITAASNELRGLIVLVERYLPMPVNRPALPVWSTISSGNGITAIAGSWVQKPWSRRLGRRTGVVNNQPMALSFF